MDIHQLAGPAREVAVYEFKVPGKAQSEIGNFGKVETVGLCELSASDELLAIARAKNGVAMQIAHELAKQSIVRVNGKKVGFADGSIDIFWNQIKPSLRAMILSAYNRINQPEEEDMDDFLNSLSLKA